MVAMMDTYQEEVSNHACDEFVSSLRCPTDWNYSYHLRIGFNNYGYYVSGGQQLHMQIIIYVEKNKCVNIVG